MDDWMIKGACRGEDTELFFPELSGKRSTINDYCRNCEVVKPCLEYALVNMIKHGTWGSLSEKQRRRMRGIRGRALRKGEDIPISVLLPRTGNSNLSDLDDSKLEPFSGKGYFR
jgi:WhiB family transcriptional regulator, redox-sensing transcriptional regulator